MSVHRSKKCRIVCKANTEGNVSLEIFVLTMKYRSDNLVLHHLFKSKESKKHAHVRRIKAKEYYFKNFLHVICKNSMEKRRKLVCSSQFKFYCVKANVIHSYCYN